MGSLFGTDGVRGLANRDITAELALRLSVAAAHVLSERVGTNGGLDASDDQLAATASSGSPRPVAVVGRDPRASGEFLQAAVVAGLAAAGVDVHVVDILPTPGVAYLATSAYVRSWTGGDLRMQVDEAKIMGYSLGAARAVGLSVATPKALTPVTVA